MRGASGAAPSFREALLCHSWAALAAVPAAPHESRTGMALCFLQCPFAG